MWYSIKHTDPEIKTSALQPRDDPERGMRNRKVPPGVEAPHPERSI